jgi:hypothetical protein
MKHQNQKIQYIQKLFKFFLYGKLWKYHWYLNKVTTISSKPFPCYARTLLYAFFSVPFSSGSLSETRLRDGPTLLSLQDRSPAARVSLRPLLFISATVLCFGKVRQLRQAFSSLSHILYSTSHCWFWMDEFVLNNFVKQFECCFNFFYEWFFNFFIYIIVWHCDFGVKIVILNWLEHWTDLKIVIFWFELFILVWDCDCDLSMRF